MQRKPKKVMSGQFVCQMMHLMLEFTLQKRYHRIIPITEDGRESIRNRMKGESPYEFCTFRSGCTGPEHDADVV